jgi:radical SAM superfamily enzyme YgiQ (UPF0313 family)
MKILLLRPNSRMIMTPMPLGLGFVAGAILKGRGDEVKIVDGRNLRLETADILREIREFKPQVVGLTATIMDSGETHTLTNAIRVEFPGMKIIIGGPYATSCHETVIADENLDVVVLGEAEETIVELLDAFDDGKSDLSGIKGIIYRDGDQMCYTEPRPVIQDLDKLDVAWDLLDPESYFSRSKRNSHNRIRKHHRVLALFSSRGCPYNCIYCHNMFGKKIRLMSADRVIDEILMLKDRYKIGELEFIDDNFNQRSKRAKDIFNQLIDKKVGLHITFPNGLRGDKLDEEMVDLFKEGGVFRISLAVESGSPRIQKVIKKKLDLDAIDRAITMVASRGIVTVGFFILGFPTETAEDMRKTVDFACKSDVHVADFFYLNPYPGTEISRTCGVNFGDISYDDFSAMPINISAASDKELHEMTRYAYRRFYSSPKRIWRILKVVPKNSHLVANAWITAKLLFQDAVSK